MQKALDLNLRYLLWSIFYGPLTLILGVAQTSGGGDTLDGAYYLPDGAFDYALRDAEFQRAGLVTGILAGVGIIIGLVSLVSLLVLRKKKAIDTLVLVTQGGLTMCILLGYALAIAVMGSVGS